MDNTADQRSVRAEVQAAREEAGTARARQAASCRTKVDASQLHRPPTSMPRTVRWQRREAASSGYARSLARQATCRAAPAVRLRMRRRAPADVSGATRVVSTATCAPFQRGRPLAMTSIRRSSSRPGSTFKSRSRTCCWTVAPASRQRRAAALSRGPPRERSTPERGHAATWSPRASKPRRQRQVAGARGSGIRSRRRSSARKRGDGRQAELESQAWLPKLGLARVGGPDHQRRQGHGTRIAAFKTR